MTYPYLEKPHPDDPWQPQVPHGQKPTARQVIGSPYVWDGGDRRLGDRSRVEPDPLVRSYVGRAMIGDELREIAVWCELGQCIARYADAAALGYADIAARAMAAGWCKDGFGRLICPPCQQRFPIWSSAPPVPRAHAAPRRLGSSGRYIGHHRTRAATHVERTRRAPPEGEVPEDQVAQDVSMG